MKRSCIRKLICRNATLDSYALSRYRIKSAPLGPDYDANETKTRKDLPDDQRLHDYKKRIDSYLEAFYDSVDIWEVGNEVNGEWVDENCNKDPKKMMAAAAMRIRLLILPLPPLRRLTMRLERSKSGI